jgi:hypothetical protein
LYKKHGDPVVRRKQCDQLGEFSMFGQFFSIELFCFKFGLHILQKRLCLKFDKRHTGGLGYILGDVWRPFCDFFTVAYGANPTTYVIVLFNATSNLFVKTTFSFTFKNAEVEGLAPCHPISPIQ